MYLKIHPAYFEPVIAVSCQYNVLISASVVNNAEEGALGTLQWERY